MAPYSVIVWLFVAAAVGCAGDIGARLERTPTPADTAGVNGSTRASNDAPGAANNSNCAPGTLDTSPTVLRRLSGLEYQLTLQDLFQLAEPPSLEGIPADTLKDGFRSFAEVQTMSAQHLRGYLDKAAELTDAMLADSARRAKLLGCAPDTADCVRTFVTRFGKLAYRRALTSSEVDSIATRATQDALDADDRVRYATEVLLTSPSFLYRIEVGDKPEGLSTLTPLELASKLSFALWGRAPSAQLLDQAAQPGFAEPAAVAHLAMTMLSDARARSFFAAFFRQWLGFDAMRAPTAPPRGWNDALLVDMQAETDRTLNEFAWNGRPFLDVLTADETYLTRELATFYGLPAPGADGRVTIPAGHARQHTGVLTHASLLSAKSDGDPIAIRGNWLRKTFLCEALSIPANIAEELGEILVGLTRVQIVARRNSDANCKSCHSTIDPIGVGFAQFDAVGRFDPALDIAQYGLTPALPGAAEPEFASIGELSAKLRAWPKVSQCIADKAFLYVGGRAAQPADACNVQAGSRAFSDGQLNFPALVQALVAAPEFRLRRAPTPTL